MLTWVICDYESNTINYDPGEGFSAATTSRAIITTSHAGEVLVECRVKSARHPDRTASVPKGAMCALDQRLWIDGNLSVDYGGRLVHEDSEPFGLIFDPGEMTQALRIPLDSVEVAENTFGTAFRDTPRSRSRLPVRAALSHDRYPESRPIHDQDHWNKRSGRTSRRSASR